MDLGKLIASDKGLRTRTCRLTVDPEIDFPVLMAKIKLTWRCNLKCRICSLWREGALVKGKDPLSVALVQNTLEILAGLGLKKVHFSGGEVLLRDDFKEIADRAVELGLQVNLTTNGTLLDKETARFLVDGRVHTVAFSVDDPVEKKHDEVRGVSGAWRMTWKGIERLKTRKKTKGRGPVLAVNTVVTRRNIERLGRLYEILMENGIESWRLLPVRTGDKKLRPRPEQWAALSRESSSWQPLLLRRPADVSNAPTARLAAKGMYAGRSFERNICYAPWFNLFIDADGSVFSCCTGRQAMPVYGNILELPLEKILSSPVRREIRSSMASGHEFRICRSCDEFLEENELMAQAALY